MESLEKMNRDFVKKRRPEIRLLIKILAVIGFVILLLLLSGYVYIRIKAPELLKFSKGIDEFQVSISLDSISDAMFITGMNACENLVLDQENRDLYVSCLDGHIYLLSPDSAGNMVLSKSFKAGNAVMGIVIDKAGDLIAAVCGHSLEEWRTKGGALYRISRDFSEKTRITDDFPSMNGICIDAYGTLYFASSNFDFINPEGNIYRMKNKGDGMFQSPEPHIIDAGLANGLYYDPFQDHIFYSNTTGGVFGFGPGDTVLQEVYLKLRFIEACDDLCTDIGGNIWMTDPGYSTIKMYNPGTKRLVRFIIDGVGQTSSCRIRSEDGLEMLYITELKTKHNPLSDKFDGRGVLVVPAQSLLKLLEPILIQ